ncbi:MAG: hypothetical protein HYT35_00805 [Candidatus Staskawiczbacteria bacterium]|nr:hypothetical protein [Candidatus Staskawiczbacteria bacterium]
MKEAKVSENIAKVTLKLMREKVFPPTHPLSVVKSVVASPIDADRIDFVQRDGLLAGGEYGHYDTRRLCDSVFIEQDEKGWLIAYSEKALTSMEALLLDRYRTYEWVHFHHRVIAVKILARYLIQEALSLQIITKDDFNPESPSFNLKDDIWLWNVLRSMESNNPYFKMAQESVFYREKKNILGLWKTRPVYHEFQEKLAKIVRQRRPLEFDVGTEYQQYLSRVDAMDMPMLTFKVDFEPVGKDLIYLYSEANKKLSGRNLFDVSKLVASLEAIWKNEPQYFVLLIGRNIRNKAAEVAEKWVTLTADWILQGRLW